MRTSSARIAAASKLQASAPLEEQSGDGVGERRISTPLAPVVPALTGQDRLSKMLWGFRHNRWRRWPRGLPRRREATVWWNVFVRGLQIPIRGLLRGRQVPVRGHQIFVRRRKVLVRGLEIPIQGVKILVLGRQVLVQDRLACRGPEEMLQSVGCPGWTRARKISGLLGTQASPLNLRS